MPEKMNISGGFDYIPLFPVLYERDRQWAVKLPYSTAANRYTLVSPIVLALNVGGKGLRISAAQELALDAAANWDTITPTDYTAAATRAGLNFYLYACDQGSNAPKFLFSANSTVPSGYDANNSRKIVGFHCLCASVGTISGHTLTGFVAGDILPNSVWDLNFRPSSAPEGMVYSSGINGWVDIYLASGTGVSTASVNNGTISDTRNWMDFVDDGQAVGKHLLGDDEFQRIALGSNEETNIAGSADPVYTGGHRDTSGTSGTSTSASSPSTNISAATNPQSLTLALNGLAPVVVSFAPAGLNSGALIAAALQVAIRAAFPWAGGLTVTYGSTYVVTCPGSYGPSASVVITAGTPNDCTAALKLGVSNGGTEASGTLGRRMISNIGCEDCCGALWQWLKDQSYQCNPDGTVQAAGSTFNVVHDDAPGGNPIYLRLSTNGIYYLACNMAAATADRYIGPTNYKVPVKHESDPATGAIGQVYFDDDVAQPARLLCNIAAIAKNVFLPTNNPAYLLQVTHNASASSVGVALYYDDGADNRLEANNAGGATAALDLALNSQGWDYYDLPGTKGSLYRQGTYGDTKLVAGAHWSHGSISGSRSRFGHIYRWYTASSLGGRFRAEHRER